MLLVSQISELHCCYTGDSVHLSLIKWWPNCLKQTTFNTGNVNNDRTKRTVNSLHWTAMMARLCYRLHMNFYLSRSQYQTSSLPNSFPKYKNAFHSQPQASRMPSQMVSGQYHLVVILALLACGNFHMPVQNFDRQLLKYIVSAETRLMHIFNQPQTAPFVTPQVTVDFHRMMHINSYDLPQTWYWVSSFTYK